MTLQDSRGPRARPAPVTGNLDLATRTSDGPALLRDTDHFFEGRLAFSHVLQTLLPERREARRRHHSTLELRLNQARLPLTRAQRG